MSITGSAGITRGQLSASFSLNLSPQKKGEEKAEEVVEKTEPIDLSQLKATYPSGSSHASMGSLLQDAIVTKHSPKKKNLLSGLFVSLVPETSKYLQAQLDGLRMQNEFASKLDAVLKSATANFLAGENSAFLERTIKEGIQQVGDEKIHEEAEDDFKKADEELEEKIEEESDTTAKADATATEGADAILKDIEKAAEEITKPESEKEQESIVEVKSVQDAVEVETERHATEDQEASAVSKETSLQAAGAAAYDNGQAADSSATPAGTYVNIVA